MATVQDKISLIKEYISSDFIRGINFNVVDMPRHCDDICMHV